MTTPVHLELSRGDVIASAFEVVDPLDESPLGVAYRVKSTQTGTVLRLTLLNPKFATEEAVQKAFEKAKTLDHPALVKVIELGTHEGTFFYTQEEFEGAKTLRDLIHQYKLEGKPFQLSDAAQVVMKICEGLQAAHEAGVVFRALRPEYILITTRTSGPRKKLIANVRLIGACFWDLVPTADLAEDEFDREEAQYLAPELRSLVPVASPSADIYTAGAILYEMLTGLAPVGTFQTPSHVRPDIPKALNDLVELVLSHAPDDRCESARSFVYQLRMVFKEAEEEPEARNVRPLIFGIVAVVLAVVVVGAIAILVQPDPAEVAAKRDTEIRQAILDGYPKLTDEEIKAILEKHPPNMAYVPAGPFLAGPLHAEVLEGIPGDGPSEIEVGAFLVDVFEYPDLLGAPPLAGKTHAEAKALCEEAGKRLCTVLEWEKACKGPLNSVYGYGDTFDPTACGEGLEELHKSGEKATCKSPWGVYDMSGNHREWTDSAPKGRDDNRIVKGGEVGTPKTGTRCAFASDEATTWSDRRLSFRCCRDIMAPPVERNEAVPDPGSQGRISGPPSLPGRAPPAGGVLSPDAAVSLATSTGGPDPLPTHLRSTEFVSNRPDAVSGTRSNGSARE